MFLQKDFPQGRQTTAEAFLLLQADQQTTSSFLKQASQTRSLASPWGVCMRVQGLLWSGYEGGRAHLCFEFSFTECIPLKTFSMCLKIYENRERHFLFTKPQHNGYVT